MTDPEKVQGLRELTFKMSSRLTKEQKLALVGLRTAQRQKCYKQLEEERARIRNRLEVMQQTYDRLHEEAQVDIQMLDEVDGEVA